MFSKQLTPLASGTEADTPVPTGLDETDAKDAENADPSPSQPFTGRLQRLDRLATVAAGTIVVVFEKGEPPLLKTPGELLIPSWIPSRGGLAVLPVITETVTLTVSVAGLLTLDGQDIEGTDVEVRVRLREPAIPALAAEHGADLGAWLTREVQVAVESSVRAAVGLNRESDLARQSLQRVLGGRWLPASFGNGALDREGFTVVRDPWAAESNDAEPVDAPPSRLESDDERHPAPPAINALGSGAGHRARRSASSPLRLVYVPAIISIGAHWLFFIVYWVPELGSFPVGDFVLGQLAPLVSKELVSRSESLVWQQADHSGLAAAFLLAVSLVLAPLAQARYWLARLALWPLTYLAGICAFVTLIGVMIRGQLSDELVGVLLLVAWVIAAVVTTWRSLWADIDTLPQRPAPVLWLIAAYVLVNPAPVAVGRAFFAPELRAAAVSVLHNDFTLRWAALLTPVTALVYLCGISVGALVWAGYLLWPPRRVTHRRGPVAVLVLAMVCLATVGPQAARSAEERARAIRTDSPAGEIGFTCGEWTQRPPGRPAQTLIVTGLTCRRVTTFTGYHELTTRETGSSLSPVNVETLDGRRIPGQIVAAQYGDVLAVAATDRIDNRATEVVGLRLVDAAQLWRFSCPPSRTLALRFAGAPSGDNQAAGRLTLKGERASVVVDCGQGAIRLDPATGRTR